jgi:alkanesulfonate monooxygenase SsuD/methylene tetrahydromethanopterin reductase-like flavin-dependent oxidoreductase (luciferase family)
MKLGLQLNSFDWVGGPKTFASVLAEIAHASEEAGFDRIAVADHVWQHPIMGGSEANEPECYAVLSFLAANTERVGLTAMVSGVHFRHPAMLVKTVTTLDVLSGGRAWLGVGSGHYEEETRGLGIPFPPQKERFEMLEETVQVALRMWSGEQGDGRSFEGQHYQQFLAAGLVDEIRIHLVNVLLGRGRHLFDRLPQRIELEQTGLSRIAWFGSRSCRAVRHHSA